MEKRTQHVGILSVLLAGLAGAAYFPARGGSADAADRAGGSSVQAAEAPREAQPVDALTLVGQYFGTDVSEAGLKRRVRTAGNRIRPEPLTACPAVTIGSLTAPIDPACRDLQVLETFFALDLDAQGLNLTAAREAVARLGACRRSGGAACTLAVERSDDATVRTFLRDYLDETAMRIDNPPVEKRRLAMDFSRLNRQELAQTEVAQAAAEHRTEISFIVATVPDGVDSFAGWSFDPAMEAIRLAAERARYVLDRFFVPDWSPRPNGVAASGRIHEEQPGVVLFRREGNPRSLLVILFALETPTDGVHAAAMDRALRLAGWWTRPEQALRILGPFYSGTTTSLHQSLRRVLPSLPSKRIQVVSGSATRHRNREDIESLTDEKTGVRVEFKAATLADDPAGLRQQLCEAYGVDRMAWLRESNTLYGASQAASAAPLPGGSTGTPVAAGTSAATAGGRCTDFSGDMEFKFPLHISRVRDLSPGGPVERQAAGAPLLPLVLRESFTPMDAFPSLSPAITSATAEMILRSIGRLIARERFRVIGLTATDARDKLFLVRAIRQIEPSVSFVTTEANLLYSHPDYSESLRGMLVASAYPLSSLVGERVPIGGRVPPKVLFSSSAAEGIFNAALSLLDDREWGELQRPLIYGRESLGNGTRRPSVWFSLVGREETWPVRRVAPAAAIADSYTLTAAGTERDDPVDVQRLAHPVIITAYLALLAIAALHVFAFFTGRPRWMTRFASRTGHSVGLPKTVPQELLSAFDASSPSEARHWIDPLRRRNQAGRYRRQLACFGSLLAVLATAGTLQLLWAIEQRGVAVLLSLLSIWIVALLALVCAACIVRIVRTLPAWQWDLSLFWRRRALYSGLVLVLAVGCAFAWTWYLADLLRLGSALPRLDIAIERYTRLANGVSPLLPLFLLAAAIYLWGFTELTGHSIPIHRRFDDALSIVNQLIGKSEAELKETRGRLITARLLAVGIVTTLGVWLIWRTRVFTFEGEAYGFAYTGAVLLVHALVAPKLIATWWRWGALSGRLDKLTRTDQPFAKAAVPEEFRPSSLFRGPRLADVRMLSLDYAAAVRAMPLLPLAAVTGDEHEAALRGRIERLIQLEPELQEAWTRTRQWRLDPATGKEALPTLNPLELFALLDRHAYDELFAETVTAAERQVVAGTSPVAPHQLDLVMAVVRQDPARADRWRATIGRRMPPGVDAAFAMSWIALTPDAANIRSLVARHPVLPVLLSRQLAADQAVSLRLPAATSRAWEKLTQIASAIHLARSNGALAGPLDAQQEAAVTRFLSRHLFISIRIAIWRIWRALAYVMAAIALVMLSLLVYPVQPRGLMMSVAAAEVLIAAAFAIRVLFAVERNTILGSLTGSTPGQVNWSWPLAGRVVAWVLIPVGGVIAARFPEVGDVILKLFSPFESLMR